METTIVHWGLYGDNGKENGNYGVNWRDPVAVGMLLFGCLSHIISFAPAVGPPVSPCHALMRLARIPERTR